MQKMKGTNMVLAGFVKDGRLERALKAAHRLERKLTEGELETITKVCLNNGWLDKAVSAAEMLDKVVSESMEGQTRPPDGDY